MRSPTKPSVMNDTKWHELRLGMLEANERIWFRGKNLDSDTIGQWDCEWFHHFVLGGHEATEWYELKADTNEGRLVIEDVLRTHHIPVEVRDGIYRIYGYTDDTSNLTYLT